MSSFDYSARAELFLAKPREGQPREVTSDDHQLRDGHPSRLERRDREVKTQREGALVEMDPAIVVRLYPEQLRSVFKLVLTC